MARQLTPKCFVISEIGNVGDERNTRANRFYFIIEEALKIVSVKLGRTIAPERFDKRRSTTIFDRVVDNILNYELVIAVLCDRNPNVHIELGIALAAARNVEILIPKGEVPPSDINNHLCVFCDLDAPQNAIDELAARLLNAIAQGEPPIAFKRYTPLAVQQPGVHYLNRYKLCTIDTWSEFLWAANEQLVIATTNLKYFADPNTRKLYSRAALARRRETRSTGSDGCDRSLVEILLMKAGLEGVRVRVMVMSGKNPFFRVLNYDAAQDAQASKIRDVSDECQRNMRLISEFMQRSTRYDVAAFLEASYPDRDFPLRDGGTFEVIPIEHGPLYRRVTLSEQGAYVTPFHLLEPYNSELPSFLVENRNVYDSLAAGNKGNDEGDVRLVPNNFYVKVLEDLNELYERNRDSAVTMTTEDCRQALFA